MAPVPAIFLMKMANKMVPPGYQNHIHISKSRIDSKCSLDKSEAKESLVKSSFTISSATEDLELEDGDPVSTYEQSKYPDSSAELRQCTFGAWVVHGLRSE